MSCKKQRQIENYIQRIPEMLASKRKMEAQSHSKYSPAESAGPNIIETIIREKNPVKKKPALSTESVRL